MNYREPGLSTTLWQWLSGWMLVKGGFAGEVEIKALGKNKKPLPGNSGRGMVCRNYFFAEQAQPQPEDFFSSCFCMVPVSVHSGHFLGLHLPSLVAPHFSHLNTAMISPFLLKGLLEYIQKQFNFCFTQSL